MAPALLGLDPVPTDSELETRILVCLRRDVSEVEAREYFAFWKGLRGRRWNNQIEMVSEYGRRISKGLVETWAIANTRSKRAWMADAERCDWKIIEWTTKLVAWAWVLGKRKHAIRTRILLRHAFAFHGKPVLVFLANGIPGLNNHLELDNGAWSDEALTCNETVTLEVGRAIWEEFYFARLDPMRARRGGEEWAGF